MKTLQNNFTTPEQSQQLKKLGLPEDSADGILRHYAWADDILDEKYWEVPMVVDSRSTISITELLDRVIDDEYDKALPCWSVGRLMEIISICIGGHGFFEYFSNENMIEHIIELMNNLKLDFSKLDE